MDLRSSATFALDDDAALVPVTATMREAFAAVLGSPAGWIAVTDPDSGIAGVLTAADIARIAHEDVVAPG